MMRVAILTTGRQDWGILRSTALRLRADPRFDFQLMVGGMHCSSAYGYTEQWVAADGLDAAERLDWIREQATVTGDTGRALAMIGEGLARQRPDALMLAGDRYETAAAALAATVERVPIIHLHGGEQTSGAFDDSLRHAITKLSHLHLVSHPDHAARVLALGEAPETVHVVGAPSLDSLLRTDLPTRRELEQDLGIELEPPVVVVTVHPTTLGRADDGSGVHGDALRGEDPLLETNSVIGAMDRVPATYVITLPNSDPGQRPIREALVAAGRRRKRRVAVEALGDRSYWALLHVADAVLGNSSSALIEASALGLPAVNVGARQEGRVRGVNVIDVSIPHVGSVTAALSSAIDPATRARLAGTGSPFGDGHSAERIVEILARWQPPQPPRKAPVPLAAVVT